MNAGVNTRDADALNQQARALRAMADVNERRARAIAAGQNVDRWSNDMSDASSFEGFPDDIDEEDEDEV